ncbi:hypothetical protein KIW84_042140 [Lathyrus oleraceus]|uniref:Uncharacterized protein n=1 Tax=Pisum sativum TaxID=3888 RepID=A0A9D4XBT1_PEA|nr:hypothetical protein KIW84_042140 [Pisum sativum]
MTFSKEQISSLQRKKVENITKVAEKQSGSTYLSRNALQKMRHIEGSLFEANCAFLDCSAMAAKLNALNDNTEEQVCSHQREAIHLVHLAAKTMADAAQQTTKVIKGAKAVG